MGVFRRWRDCEQALDEITGRGVVDRDVFESVENVEAIVEAALQTVDDGAIKALEMRLVEVLIKPILALNHKVQAPFAVVDVEGEQELHPKRNQLVRRHGF